VRGQTENAGALCKVLKNRALGVAVFVTVDTTGAGKI
jgi:hypothetical protein